MIYVRDLPNMDLLTVPYPRTEIFEKFPIYSLPKLWNTLNATKYLQNKTAFRIYSKEKLLN
jgi:hypothetical protein